MGAKQSFGSGVKTPPQIHFLGECVASLVAVVKLGIDCRIRRPLRLWIPSDRAAQFVGNIAKGTGCTGAVSDFYRHDRVFSLADAVDKVDVVGAKAKILRLFA